MTENWKPVARYEGFYEVSDQGRVRSLKLSHTGKTKILKTGKSNGYLYVYLYKDGKRKTMLVHRFVAEAFIPNPNNLPQVNHKNELKTNNAASNLEWCTAHYNSNYGTRTARISKPVRMFHKFTNEPLATFPSATEAERQTGIAGSHICSCCNGDRKSAGGFVWRYAPDEASLRR